MSLQPLGSDALDGVLGVREQVAVEGPGHVQHFQGGLALLLRRLAHRAAGLQHPPVACALGHEDAAGEQVQVAVAWQLHQHLRAREERSGRTRAQT